MGEKTNLLLHCLRLCIFNSGLIYARRYFPLIITKTTGKKSASFVLFYCFVFLNNCKVEKAS